MNNSVKHSDQVPILTKREKEVLVLIAHEYTTDMIADELYISPHTVISHRNNMRDKLHTKNVAGLIRRGFEIGALCTTRDKALSY